MPREGAHRGERGQSIAPKQDMTRRAARPCAMLVALGARPDRAATGASVAPLAPMRAEARSCHRIGAMCQKSPVLPPRAINAFMLLCTAVGNMGSGFIRAPSRMIGPCGLASRGQCGSPAPLGLPVLAKLTQ